MTYQEATKYLRENRDILPQTLKTERGKYYFNLPNTLEVWRHTLKNGGDQAKKDIKHKVIELVEDLINQPENWNAPRPTENELSNNYHKHESNTEG